MSVEAPDSGADGSDGIADEVPSGVGVSTDIGFGEAGGDELEDFVEGSESHPHDGGDDGEGEAKLGCGFDVELGADDFPAGDGGAEESEGVDDLVVSGEVWVEAEGVQDWDGAIGDEVGADGDGASDHVEESPAGEEPEGGVGEADSSVDFYEDVDDDEEGAAVEEELVVALVECGDGCQGHECEDEEGEAFGDWGEGGLHALIVVGFGGGCDERSPHRDAGFLWIMSEQESLAAAAGEGGESEEGDGGWGRGDEVDVVDGEGAEVLCAAEGWGHGEVCCAAEVDLLPDSGGEINCDDP